MGLTNSTLTTAGWIGFIACVGMMSTLMYPEVAALHTWDEAARPVFVAKAMLHLGIVITSFISGKIIPESREDNRTRKGDPQ